MNYDRVQLVNVVRIWGCMHFVDIVIYLHSRLRKARMEAIPEDMDFKKLSFDMVYDLVEWWNQVSMSLNSFWDKVEEEEDTSLHPKNKKEKKKFVLAYLLPVPSKDKGE